MRLPTTERMKLPCQSGSLKWQVKVRAHALTLPRSCNCLSLIHVCCRNGLRHLPLTEGDVMAHTSPYAAHEPGDLQADSGGNLRIPCASSAQNLQPPVPSPGKLLASAEGQGDKHLAKFASLRGHGRTSPVQLTQDICAFEALLPAFACSHNIELQASIQQLHHQLTSSQKELCGHERRISMIVDHMQVALLLISSLSFAERRFRMHGTPQAGHCTKQLAESELQAAATQSCTGRLSMHSQSIGGPLADRSSSW